MLTIIVILYIAIGKCLTSYLAAGPGGPVDDEDRTNSTSGVEMQEAGGGGGGTAMPPATPAGPPLVRQSSMGMMVAELGLRLREGEMEKVR